MKEHDAEKLINFDFFQLKNETQNETDKLSLQD